MKLKIKNALATSAVLLATSIVGTALPLAADDNDRWRDRRDDRRDGYYGRDDRYRDRDDRYGNRGNSGYRGGYGMDPASVIARVRNDLRAAQMRNRVDGHERNHFNEAQRALYDFESRWRSGQFDRGRLDRAIDHIGDLARADQVHPRDRQALAADLNMLRGLRQSGASARNSGYGNYRGWLN